MSPHSTSVDSTLSSSPIATALPPVSHLSDLLTRHVQGQPERAALGTSDLRTILSYRELHRLTRSVLAQLSQLGLRRGDCVALVADNSIEFVLALLATVSCGARLAPLNPELSPGELRRRLSQLSATAVLAPEHLAGSLKLAELAPPGIPNWIMNVAGEGASPTVRIRESGAPSSPRTTIGGALPSTNSNDIALLLFTGGTTGPPKLVPLTHGNVAASLSNIASCCGLSPEDATLLIMPMFHGHGLIAGLLATLFSGGSAYLPSTGAFSAHRFWPDVIRLGVTWYTAVPTIHRILLLRATKEYPESLPVPLRFIRSCSAPMDQQLAASVSSVFGAPVISAYGMTETSHQVSSTPLSGEDADKASSVGLPVGVELRIAGDDGSEVATGGVGEVWVRGATVTAGYWNNPESNASSFLDGWFRTGDLGRRDADGYLFLKGRIKEMINRGGEKISPSDVDAALLSHPKVLEAASFGGHDAIYGEDVQAAVILRPGVEATEAELRDYCRSQLSAFEVPDRIYIVSDLPRTPKGTVNRRALAAKFSVLGTP